jgi:hypothetical protein
MKNKNEQVLRTIFSYINLHNEVTYSVFYCLAFLTQHDYAYGMHFTEVS